MKKVALFFVVIIAVSLFANSAGAISTVTEKFDYKIIIDGKPTKFNRTANSRRDKNYEWILCENSPNTICGPGKKAVEKMQPFCKVE